MHPITRPLTRLQLDAAELASLYPPKWKNRYKKLVNIINQSPHEGEIVFTRWDTVKVDRQLSWNPISKVSIHPGVFTYPESDSTRLHWTMNFADYVIFAFHDGHLLAQDELQVLEHPILGSLLEYLALNEDHAIFTSDQDGATPILIRNVQRRIEFDTQPSMTSPKGLYGNRFRKAPLDEIFAAVTPLLPPTRSNILALEAPAPSLGYYSRRQIVQILETAVSGFTAMCLETKIANPEAIPVLHTGFWGCGAYGGDRELMTLLQLIAASLVGVQDIWFHTVDQEGVEIVQNAFQKFKEVDGVRDLKSLLTLLESFNYQWGESDGN